MEMNLTLNAPFMCAGENISRVLHIDTGTVFLGDKSVHIAFISPGGKTYMTEELNEEELRFGYEVPAQVLDRYGKLRAQLIVTNGNGYCKKSDMCMFDVRPEIDGDCAVPENDGLVTLEQLDGRLAELEREFGDAQRLARASSLGIVPDREKTYSAQKIGNIIAAQEKEGIYFDFPGVYKFESGIKINRPFAFYLAPGAVIENTFTAEEATPDPNSGRPMLGKEAGYLFTVACVDGFTVSGGEFRRIQSAYGGNYLPDGESLIHNDRTGIFKFVDSVNVIFENVKFSRNDTGQCIKLTNSERVRITGCRYKDFRTGVLFDCKAKNVAVENCDFVNSFVPKKRTIGDKSYGLEGGDQYWAYCVATGWDKYNEADDSAELPVTLPLADDCYPDGVTVRNCSAVNCQWEAFDSHGGSNIIFDNLDIHNATTAVTCYCDERPKFADTPDWHNVRISNIYAHNDGIVYTVDDSDPDDLKAVVTDPGFTYPSAARRITALACRAWCDRRFRNMSFENIRLVNPLFWSDTVIRLNGQRGVSIKNMSIEFDNMFGGEKFNTGSVTYPRYFDRRPCLKFENTHVSIDGLTVKGYTPLSRNISVCAVEGSFVELRNGTFINGNGKKDIIKTEIGENNEIIYHVRQTDIKKPYAFVLCRRPCRVTCENVAGEFEYYDTTNDTAEPRPAYAPFTSSLIATGEPMKNNKDLLQKWDSDGELRFASGFGWRHNNIYGITAAINVFDGRAHEGEPPQYSSIYHENLRGVKNCIEYVRPYKAYTQDGLNFPDDTTRTGQPDDLTHTVSEPRETAGHESVTANWTYPLYFPYHYVIPGQAVGMALTNVRVVKNTVTVASDLNGSLMTIPYSGKTSADSLVGMKIRFLESGYEFSITEENTAAGTFKINTGFRFDRNPVAAGTVFEVYEYQNVTQETIVSEVGQFIDGVWYIALADMPLGEVTGLSVIQTTAVSPTAAAETQDGTVAGEADVSEE